MSDRNLGEGARKAAVGHFHPLHQTALVGLGEVCDMLLEEDVVLFQDWVIDEMKVVVEQLFFPLGVQDGKPLGHLVADDALGEVHPFLEQDGDLLVRGLDLLPDFLQVRQRGLGCIFHIQGCSFVFAGMVPAESAAACRRACASRILFIFAVRLSC